MKFFIVFLAIVLVVAARHDQKQRNEQRNQQKQLQVLSTCFY